MKVSVLLCSYRSGGVDVALAGLAKQTFSKNDYEVIFCDALYKKRKTAVRDFMYRKYPDIPLVHVEPFRNQFPLDSGSKHRNSAIAYAEGELCIFLCDYAFVRRDFVERHWNIYERDHKTTAMSPHRYWNHPKIRPDWKDRAISVFSRSFSPATYQNEGIWNGGQDPKLNEADGKGIGWMFFHLKNESVPTDVLMELNGCDEGYDVDGGHLYSDQDLGLRCDKVGHHFILDRGNIAEIIQVRDFYPTLERHRTYEQDYAYFKSRQDAGVLSPFNNFNLAEIRRNRIRQKKRRRS